MVLSLHFLEKPHQKEDFMPHLSTSQSQISRKGQMNKTDLLKAARTAIPRDDLQSAYSGDENLGPARQQKSKNSRGKTKGRRLRPDSEKTPVR